jgi:hypothetical protein
MGNPPHLSRVRFGDTDVEPSVQIARVGVDDLTVELTSERDAEGRLANGGRTGDGDEASARFAPVFGGGILFDVVVARFHGTYYGATFLALFAILAQFAGPLTFGNNLALAAIVVGFAKPPIIEAIYRRSWSSEIKAIKAFVVRVPAAQLVVNVMGNWKPEELPRTFPIIFAAAIAFHRF